jgi:glycerol-3-phosphate dehydrogenase
MDPYEIIIIGAGVVGCAIARELSEFQCRTLVVEQCSDVGFATSSRNSGVLHSGIHYTPGSLRAAHAVRGNEMTVNLCRKLGVPYRRTGKLTVAHTPDQEKDLIKLLKQGEENGVPGLSIIAREEMERIQPGISGFKALLSETTGIISPYEYTIALAEQAHERGTDFRFDANVINIEYTNRLYTITIEHTRDRSRETVRTKTLVNAAGLGSDTIARMLGVNDYTIYPCRGEYYVIDKRLGGSLNTLIYPVPGFHSSGLGIHLTQTVEGVILIGPSNEYITDKEDLATTEEVMQQLKREGRNLLPGLSDHDFIRSFSGIRPKLTPPELGGFGDFVIDDTSGPPGSIILTGIESPGLTAAASIAQEVVQRLSICISLRPRLLPDVAEKKARRRFLELPETEQRELLRKDPEYGQIVCRCEHITKAEVKQAVERIFGPITYNGIKLRCRAMMGRCQGGFCLPRIAEILLNEYGLEPEEHLLKGPESHLFIRRLREESHA